MVSSRERLRPAVRSFLDQRNALSALLAEPATAGLTLSQRHAVLADELLSQLYAAALREAPLGSAPAALLAAVGGYGREQLGWKSDLDVLFVTDGDTAQISGFVEAMLYPLWDAGIALGHQVMRLSDLVEDARESLPTATALLDFRPLAGSVSLGERLREHATEVLFQPSVLPGFIARLGREVEDRWRRYGDSPYLLEPDVKNGAGGLRDVDVASWAARACFPGSNRAELVRTGVLTAPEEHALQDATEFFFRVRNLLHELVQRRHDRLMFDQQEQVALRMGYGQAAEPGASEVEVTGRMVETFMSDYYRHARAVTRAQEQILSRVRDQGAHKAGPSRVVQPGIITQDGKLGFASADEVERNPALALRLYELACAREELVLPSARDLLTQLTATETFCEALRQSPAAARSFLQLLCTVAETPFRNGSILSELHAVGLLVAMIPEFAPVIGRVHHDLYHVYTVDVHSVAAVDLVRALTRGELMQRHPRACRLAAEAVHPQRLFLATLLHDIGKVFGGREHSERGADMVRTILQRFGLDHEDIEHVAKLVLLHLSMYFVAARRDLTDPHTIEQFAGQVGDLDCLRDLYVLTVADISTTAPTSMTTWKSRMLDELYGSTDEYLSGKSRSQSIARARSQLLEQTRGLVATESLEELLRSLPERYLLSNTPHEIAQHAQVVQASRGKRLHIALVPSRHEGVGELCVVTGAATDDGGVGDRPGLLATIAAALTACKLEILAAQIYTRAGTPAEQRVLDVFWVRDRINGLPGVQAQLPQLERTIDELLSGALTFEEVLRRRTQTRWSERPAPPVATEISIDDTSSSHYTIIEVIAQDRPGLLFTLANALYEARLSIEFAKVNTEGNRVIDIFYVTELDETKISSRERAEQLMNRLKAAL